MMIILVITSSLFIQGVVKFPEEKAIDKTDKINIVYLGDSVVHTVSNKDINKETLSQLVSDNETFTISHGSYNSIIYEKYLIYLEKNNKFPETIIIGINLRSFSYNQYLRPRYQFTYEQLLLEEKYFEALIEKFNNLFVQTPKRINEEFEEYSAIPVDYNNTVIGTVKDYYFWLDGTEENFESRITDWVIFTYLYQLKEDHLMLESLRNIDAISKRNNARLIIYVTPVDYETSKEYVVDFVPIIKQNIRIINDSLKYAEFYDYSTILSEENFMYEVMIDEHLNEQGRKILSEEIKKALKNK